MDSTKQPIQACLVWLFSNTDTLHTTSSVDGTFSFNKLSNHDFTIKINHLKYESLIQNYNLKPTDTVTLKLVFTLKEKNNTLKEFIVRGFTNLLSLKGDTLEYNINSFNLKENAVVEDLLKRLPGISVDQEGNLTTNGKKISKIKINGQDMPISKISDLTRLFPTAILDKVQIIEDYGELARITGRKSDLPEIALNLQIQSNLSIKNQLTMELGLGNDKRYKTSLLALILRENKNLYVDINSNNTEGIQGVNNITNSNITYHKSKENTKSEFSLRTTTIENRLNYISESITTTSDGILYSDNNSSQQIQSNEYELFLRQEYNTQKKQRIIYSVNGKSTSDQTTNNTQSKQTGIQRLTQNVVNTTQNKVSDLSGYFLFSNLRNATKRVFTISSNANISWNNYNLDNFNNLHYLKLDSDSTILDSIYHQQIFKNQHNSNIRINSSWVEKFRNNVSMELNYNFNYSHQHTNPHTHNVDENATILVDSLSIKNDYYNSLQSLIYNIKKSGKKYDFTLGMNYRVWLLRNMLGGNIENSVKGSKATPFFTFKYNATRKTTITLSYNNIIHLLSYKQISIIPDRSNIQNPVFGNPYLKPPMNTLINLQLKHVGNIIALFDFNADLVNNNVSPNMIILKDTLNSITQEIHLINTNGDYKLGSEYNISKQTKGEKIQLTLEGSSKINKQIVYMENLKKESKNFYFNHAIRFSTYQQKIEISTLIGYAYNKNIPLTQDQNTSILQTLKLQLLGKFYFSRTWNIQYDINKEINKLSNNKASSNPLILNAKIEKQLINNALTFRLQGSNLLNQSSNFSQSINPNIITNTRNNLNGRFIYISAILNFKN